MSNIAEAKRKLPLPTLMNQLGLGEHAKKSARCPFHEDKHPSFGIWQNERGWFFKCQAGCGAGDEITFLELHHGISNADAIGRYLEMAGANGYTPSVANTSRTDQTQSERSKFEWRACVEAFTPENLQRLAHERGYSPEFCSWLHQHALIGLYDGCIALPIHDSGKVVAAHCKNWDRGTWWVHPGGPVKPLIIGDLSKVTLVHLFESQWDAFAVADKLALHEKEGVALVITRGASKGALVSGLIPPAATAFAWKQNDELKNGKCAGDGWLKVVAEHADATVQVVTTPAQFKDANEWTKAGATVDELESALDRAEVVQCTEPTNGEEQSTKQMVVFLSPSEIRAYDPPPGHCLIGDNHIQRNSPFVIGGAPGVGKSHAATRLAICGATMADYFGMKVHRQFRTMILQCENGRARLKGEFEQVSFDAPFDEFVRVSPPPPFGFAFDDAEFLAQLKAAVDDFQPDVFLLDPWNRRARDEKVRDYREAFERILSVLPVGDVAPAVGIVAHTRKPRHDERASGRALLQTLSGSYVLGSIPRSVFVMQHASDDVDDQRRVWTCCKNNDRAEGHRSAWRWQQSEFLPLSDFDWEEFDGRNDSERKSVTAADMAELFADGVSLTRKAATEALIKLTGLKKTACYNALALDGKFTRQLTESGGLLRWNP